MVRLRRIVGGNRLIRRIRFMAETVFTPRVRVDLSVLEAHVAHIRNVSGQLDARLTTVERSIDRFDRHLPTLLNVISSGDGATRLLRRELGDLKWQVEEVRASTSVAELAESVAAHADTQSWLLERVEMIRAEMLYELRYGDSRSSADTETAIVEIVEPSALAPDDGTVRLNLGCGHLPIEGFANVDMRNLPGVDVVAPVDEIPVEPGSVTEIFSAHLLEHFPEEQLRRQLLPYWVGLLKPGGTFRAIVPDMGAMAAAVVSGDLDFDTFRSVTYGGQEYEGDIHFNGFTTEHLSSLLKEVGLRGIEVLASGRPNGDCLELEISATRPL